MPSEIKRFTLRVTAIVTALLIGVVIMTSSLHWAKSLCKSECSCTAEYCCQISEACPSYAPCSCLRDTNNSTNATCQEEEDRNCENAYPLAATIAVLGLCTFSVSFLFLFFLFMFSILGLFFSQFYDVELSWSIVCTPFKTLFSRLRGQPIAPTVELSTV